MLCPPTDQRLLKKAKSPFEKVRFLQVLGAIADRAALPVVSHDPFQTGSQPRPALLLPVREQGRQLAGAGVVAVSVDGGPCQAGQATQAAADQAPQQVGVRL